MDVDEVLTRGVAQVLPSKESLKKLMTEKTITLYQGFDPSAPSLHLGNFVGLMKLRQFQKLGHKVIFLVGDFTGMIGDPDKIATRQPLTRPQIKENVKLWLEQAGRVLDFKGENQAKIVYNYDWNSKLTPEEILEITSKITHQQLMERDMFQKRIASDTPIYMNEILYPIFQGYDSVHLDVDLEIGGNDQLFNMLVGRNLMRAMKNRDKFVLATKLLVDKEGNKVGKTTGNALFLSETPTNFYGGIMSFPDEVLTLGFELLTEVDLKDVTDEIKNEPMSAKKHLAHEVVSIIWGKGEADYAQTYFETTFQERKPADYEKLPRAGNLVETLAQLSSVGSKSQAHRLIEQGAIEVNSKKASADTEVKPGDKIKVGKKTFVKIT